MTIFEYQNYKMWVNDWVKAQPKNGYGMYRRIADHLSSNSVTMTQIFRSGLRDLTLEQGLRLAVFLGLSTLESDYFLLLIQKARAGSVDLEKVIDRQLSEIRSRGQSIKNRIEHTQLKDEDKALFYSSWQYSAVWLAATLPGVGSAVTIARRLSISEESVTQILNFLVEKKLLHRRGKYFEFGTQVVHVPSDSPLVARHHLNWRMKALQATDRPSADSLHYSAPMAIAEELRQKIREELVQFIQKQTRRVADSPSEKLVCLNLDWFEF